MMEKTLIIGNGEIGRSLTKVLSPFYEVVTKDVEDKVQGIFKVIHICYPYSPNFLKITRKYIEDFKPHLVIVHSTVKPGTTRELGSIAVHSPVNGRHPNLEQGIKTFVKFVGGISSFKVFETVQFLGRAGIRTFALSSPEATEIAKILCTTQLGWSVIIMKEIIRICEEYKVPFHEVYTEWNSAYNEGYTALKDMRFSRPNLYPMAGEIGGHCVVPNCDLLPDFITSLVKEMNKKYAEFRIVPPKKEDERKERKK